MKPSIQEFEKIVARAEQVQSKPLAHFHGFSVLANAVADAL